MTPELAFGKVLQRVRKERTLSQEDLAFKSQLDRVFISRLENGHRQPTISTIFRLCDALDIRPSQLITEVEKLVAEGSGEAD